MKYLLDTCVISELIKQEPNQKVVQWIGNIEEANLFISVLTIGELHKGIEKLPDSRKKSTLHKWVMYDLRVRFKNRIIDFDIQAATTWGKIQAQSELLGKTLPAIDGLIAATGLFHDLVVVTRNIKDMKVSGVELLNPWT
ncbi:PilT protein domain protein [Desulfamplus magnetovallimortis]|uniref:PilT protein domain protein n=1 Tax=Desulfamplus magnetovallimortis TaxID=1246637 RepID=A0A1W1HB49_9BACT|nr:type II toxin-antitoxin system VapC family toxin [Desulfamplus magnetovallimortis]SLM29666.1 PilT protein domain protein [Desulfamplus magnetovallimortis]